MRLEIAAYAMAQGREIYPNSFPAGEFECRDQIAVPGHDHNNAHQLA